MFLNHGIFCLHARLPPQCHTNSPPNLWESPLAHSCQAFLTAVERAASIFPGKSIPPPLGLVSQCKQDFDKWKSRCAVTWSRRSKCSCLSLCESVFLQLWGVFAGVRSPTPLNFCLILLPAGNSGFKIHLQELSELTLSWTISRGCKRGRNRRRRLEPENAKD